VARLEILNDCYHVINRGHQRRVIFDVVPAHRSQEAGPRIAAILSIVETCRRLQIPIRDYLTAILPGLADLLVSRVAGLTPTAWAARS
jgi:hypothetical protein